MAQYLAMPATSAGVERLFSKATLVYGDLVQAMKEETMPLTIHLPYMKDCGVTVKCVFIIFPLIACMCPAGTR